MAKKEKPNQSRRISGGPAQHDKATKEERGESERGTRYESVPPEDKKQRTAQQGVARVIKTIVVHDERGQIVSVTKVSPEARFGVGVKPQPGQTVKEYEAGTLAEDPLAKPARD